MALTPEQVIDKATILRDMVHDIELVLEEIPTIEIQDTAKLLGIDWSEFAEAFSAVESALIGIWDEADHLSRHHGR